MESTIEFHTTANVESYRGPQSWNDLSREQLLLWCGILGQELTKDEALFLACVKFYNLPRERYLNIPQVYDLHLCWKMEWLLINKLTTNVIGKFNIFFRSYYGPANRLANLTIGEYRKTELFSICIYVPD